MVEKLLPAEKLRQLAEQLNNAQSSDRNLNVIIPDFMMAVMGLHDIDLNLTLEAFKDLIQMMIRGITRFVTFFHWPFNRFFINQLVIYGLPRDEAIALLKETFKKNAPNGTRWQFDRPDGDGDFNIHDITRPAEIKIVKIIIGDKETGKTKPSADDDTFNLPPEFWKNTPQN